MLSTSAIEKPKINIELCGTDTNIPPISKVKIMEENEFEQFTLILYRFRRILKTKHCLIFYSEEEFV